MKINTQPIEKRTCESDGSLEIVNVWRTIQGEGPFSGMPAVFIRLAGCNLNCPLCDTDYTSYRNFFSIDRLMGMVTSRFSSWGRDGLVVLTGGEPYRQNIGPFIAELLDCHYKVQIETNGTLNRDDVSAFVREGRDLTVVVSPKAGRLHPHLCFSVLKYVGGKGTLSPEDGLPMEVLGRDKVVPARPPKYFPKSDVYLQPIDVQDEVLNRNHRDAVVESCLTFGWRLCLQTHKIVGLE